MYTEYHMDNSTIKADSRLAPSQWETSLQSNAISHWLDANLKSALYHLYKKSFIQMSHTFTTDDQKASNICNAIVDNLVWFPQWGTLWYSFIGCQTHAVMNDDPKTPETIS